MKVNFSYRRYLQWKEWFDLQNDLERAPIESKLGCRIKNLCKEICFKELNFCNNPSIFLNFISSTIPHQGRFWDIDNSILNFFEGLDHFPRSLFPNGYEVRNYSAFKHNAMDFFGSLVLVTEISIHLITISRNLVIQT